MKRVNKETMIRYVAPQPEEKRISMSTTCVVCGDRITRSGREFCWRHSPYVIAMLASKEFRKDQRQINKIANKVRAAQQKRKLDEA